MGKKVGDFTPGHLDKNSEGKINTVSVINGQIIYSEKSGMKFVDFADKRHTYGSVLTGMYNNSGVGSFVDFSSKSATDVLQIIINNDGLVADGQLIKIGSDIYQYRKINNHHLITKPDATSVNMKNNKDQLVYAIYLSEYKNSETINSDILLSAKDNSDNDNLCLFKVINSKLDNKNIQDITGTMNGTGTTDPKLQFCDFGNGLYGLCGSNITDLKIVSCSVKYSGTKYERLYVVASDLNKQDSL